MPRANHGGTVFIVSIFIFLIILIVGGGGAYAVAYEKVNIGNSTLQHTVGDFVLGLPFAPKTPRYLLTKALIAQKNVSKHSVDVSLASSLSGLATPLGLSSLDANLKGAVDYSNPKNPRLSLSLSVIKDFNADICKNDSLIYFKINKLPMTLLTPFLNLTASDSANIEKVLQNWVSYDTTPLQGNLNLLAQIHYNGEHVPIQSGSLGSTDKEVSKKNCFREEHLLPCL